MHNNKIINKKGRIEVIFGPMFSGKTEELVHRVSRAQIARQKAIESLTKYVMGSQKTCLAIAQQKGMAKVRQ